MKKDKLFKDKKDRIKPFEFNKEVTRVFNDMLTRSVPLYQESIKRQAQLALRFFQDKSRIYDLGCSHGNLGLEIVEAFEKKSFLMVGVDSSQPMIDKYKNRLEKKGINQDFDLVCGKIEDTKIENASVVLINLTIQFLSIPKRKQIIEKVYHGLLPGGILVLTEKIIQPSQRLTNIQDDFYKQFKLENGYSELEISQKRDALEKVLVPESLQTHEKRIEDAGFSDILVWLKWFNFASILAIK